MLQFVNCCITDPISPTNAFLNRECGFQSPSWCVTTTVPCHLSKIMSAVPDQTVAAAVDDDRKLEELGYIPSFRREFSNLATVRRRFSGDLLRPHL